MIVDFIIPTYNRIKELKSMLYSLLAQTNPNWVANVVIDNNIDEFNQIDIVKDERIKYTLLDKRYNDWGHMPREFGKQNSNAKYIIMTGDDNYYTPNFVEELNKASESNPALIYWDMVHSHYDYQFFKCSPRFNQIDIGAFAIRNDVGKNIILGKEYAADGYFIEKVIQSYQDHIKIDKVLYVHN
jgi:glycosyltransferase involved in cell wall biosynthesis